MITSFLLHLVLGVVTALFSLLPSWSVDPGGTVGQYSNSFATSAGSLDGYVPLRLALACLGVLISLRLFLLVWKGALFVYGLIPFKAT